MSLSPDTFAFVQRLLAQHSAIVLDDGKWYLVENRLRPLARQAGCASVEELVQRVRREPHGQWQQQIIDAMTTNETSFFRDRIPFERLREDILPDLIRRRAGTRQLSVWSAGCAGGQEIYSVAMLIQEYFPELRDWKVRLLGSDLSTEVLSKARAGRFSPAEVQRGLPTAFLDRYFHRVGRHWHVVNSIRSMVEFRQFNLHGDWPQLSAMDIVLLRNVLVYFDLATKKQILHKVRRVLRPDGYLLLGGAESTVHVDDGFVPVRSHGFSYYRLK